MQKKIFSFRRYTIQVITCRFGLDIEAVSYEEALEQLRQHENGKHTLDMDWHLEQQEEKISDLSHTFFYIGIRVDGKLKPKEQQIIV